MKRDGHRGNGLPKDEGAPDPLDPSDELDPLDELDEKGRPLDLDEIAAREADAEASLGFWGTFKRVMTPVTREDARIYKHFFPYIRPHIGKIVVATILSAFGGSLVVAQLMLIESGVSVIAPGADEASSKEKGGGGGRFGFLEKLSSKPDEKVEQPAEPSKAEDTAQEQRGELEQPAEPSKVEDTAEEQQGEPEQPAEPPLTAAERHRNLGLISLLFVAVILAGALAKFLQTFIMTMVGRKVIRHIREDCFQHLVRLPLRFHQNMHSGKLIARIIKDVNRLRDLLTTTATTGSREIFVFLGAFIYAVSQTSAAALFAVLFVVAAIVPIRIVADRIRHRDKSAEAGSGDMFAILTEALSAQKVIKTFSAEKYETRRFKAATKSLYRKQMVTQRLRAITEPLVDIVGGLGIAAGIFILGGWVIEGQLQVAVLLAVILALQKLSGSVRKLGKLQNDFVRSITAAGRVHAILVQVPEVREDPEAVPLRRFQNSIQYRDVRFKYQSDMPVLKGVTLEVKKGETVAIVGPSGAGKTSLVDLLPRLYDVAHGAILVDGRDIRGYTLKSLRDKIGVVSQDTMLFKDSIADNISYGLKKVSRESVEAAARAANAHDFIMAKPEGYDTPLGERGGRLSGGERQRVAIARAILKNPPILILDEATSALDAEAEAQVQSALAFLMEGRTTLVIAHRLSTIHRADKIVVLDQGQIVESGSHADLIALNGRYARAYHLQMDALAQGDQESTLDDFFSGPASPEQTIPEQAIPEKDG